MERAKRMGEDSIPRLLFHFSGPAITGLLANALYNIVDRIFVGHAVGPTGIASIGVAFPFMVAVIAVGLLIGVGSSALISISLGEKKRRRAEIVLGNAIALLAIASIVGFLLGWLFLDEILRLAEPPTFYCPTLGNIYGLSLWESLFHSSALVLIILSGQKALPFAMMTLLLGAGINIVLDAVMILVFDMGLEGAALPRLLLNSSRHFGLFLFCKKKRIIANSVYTFAFP